MSQHNLLCPTCKVRHEADVFRSGGQVMRILFSSCKTMITTPSQITKLMGIDELHRQRMLNMEMPVDEGEGRCEIQISDY